MNRRRVTGITVGIVLLLFVFSTMPLYEMHDGDGNELRAVVSQMQRLSVDHVDGADFRIVLTNAITCLKTAAGFNLVSAHTEKRPSSEKSSFVVSIRLPYLLAKSYTVEAALSFRTLPPTEMISNYLSHITTPEPPHPIEYLI